LRKQTKKSGHGGARPGAGRKPAELACPTCKILSQQLELSQQREAKLLKQLERKDAQIGCVIENKFETVRINCPMPQPDKPALPVDQMMDVEATDDQGFVDTIAQAIN
jgi:hypothetical protein